MGNSAGTSEPGWQLRRIWRERDRLWCRWYHRQRSLDRPVQRYWLARLHPSGPDRIGKSCLHITGHGKGLVRHREPERWLMEHGGAVASGRKLERENVSR